MLVSCWLPPDLTQLVMIQLPQPIVVAIHRSRDKRMSHHLKHREFNPNGLVAFFFFLELAVLAGFLVVVRVWGFGVRVIAGGIRRL
jgi:hypothetical protein